ncbi:MAG: hypothetical protein DMF64_09595 [Acidobacteria bacterium]|nr:MAG: hypothetical protein DMF64_09595 [Acidobacteriota bacterium]
MTERADKTLARSEIQSMVKPNSNGASTAAQQPPPLARDAQGAITTQSLADLIQWFLDHDSRVNAIRQPQVEEIFQWKQAASARAGEAVYQFDHAEDRLAVGIVQAVTAHADERALHEWISQLLNALEEASQTNEELAQSYQLDAHGAASTVQEAAKIPTERGRNIYLTCCWLETLCTAEVRVLGWVYQELYGRAFQPNNF